MTDRELLELAAKAYQANNPAWHQEPYDAFRKGFMQSWFPHRVVNDAFRLAFHLGMDVDFGACRIVYGDDDSELEWDGSSGDINVALEAITRAAAEIGRAMG